MPRDVHSDEVDPSEQDRRRGLVGNVFVCSGMLDDSDQVSAMNREPSSESASTAL